MQRRHHLPVKKLSFEITKLSEKNTFNIPMMTIFWFCDNGRRHFIVHLLKEGVYPDK